MKATIKTTKEVNIELLRISVEGHYWEDGTVNGVEDTEGTLIPFRKQDAWEPTINVNTGQILKWPAGMTADVHYKVRDQGIYELVDENGKVIATREDSYVPSCLSPLDDGFGDYVILTIDENGFIKGWEFTQDDIQRWEDEQ